MVDPLSQELLARLTRVEGDVAQATVSVSATAPSNPATGDLWYDTNYLALRVYDGTEWRVAGDHVLIPVHNDTGSTINRTRAVYVSGSNGGGVATVALAKADSASTMPAIGLADQDIAPGADGFVLASGMFEDVNTSSFSSGDALYVSPTTAGGFTRTRPTDPAHLVQKVALITHANTNGAGIVMGAGRANDVNNEITALTGVALGEEDLGAFTGTTIPDDQTIKEALQSLETAVEAASGVTDHGALTGLSDDDHTQYLLADGTRSVSGDLDVTGDVTIGGQVEIPRQVSYGTRHLGTFYPLVGLGSANQRIFGDLISNTGKRYQITGPTGDLEMMTNAANVIFRNGALNAETLRIQSDGRFVPTSGALQVTGNIECTGNLRPLTDAVSNIGQGGRRWSAVYLSNGVYADGNSDLGGDLTVGGSITVGTGRLDMGNNSIVDVSSLTSVLVNSQALRGSSFRPQSGVTNADIGGGGEPFRNLSLTGNITVDGTVDGRDIATDGTKLDGIQAAVAVGSTAPVSPSGGDLWFHTTDQELYAYDSSRSKWLSVTTYEAHFGRGGTLTANHYMRGPGGFDYNTGGQNGHPMRYDTTVIAAWGSAASGGTSGWNHRIMRWDDSAGANGVAASYAPSGTYTRWQKTDFNVDYDTNDLLALNMFDLGSATGVSNHTAVIAYKRRAS